MENIFVNLWEIAETLIRNINKVWQWLNNDISINIPLKIPVILPDGIAVSLGYSPIELLGAGIVILLGLWVLKSLIPMTWKRKGVLYEEIYYENKKWP